MENIMMYNEKLVAVVKCKGKVLREFNGKVFIPFGSEYSITINNLNIRKAVVSVTVDGEDVLDGNSLIVDADSKASLEGFLKGKRVTNKFKFIEKTSKIEKHRGNKAQDGLVRITYRFEADPIWNQPTIFDYESSGDDVFGSSTGNPSRDVTYSACNTARRITKSKSFSASVNEDGITGKGGASNQKFKTGTIGQLEWQSHVIVLELKGKTKNSPVDTPVFTKTKFQDCSLCGTRNRLQAKFCSECGNAMVMFA